MSSTLDEFECPKCGRMATKETDTRTCESHVSCRCGWNGEEVNERVPAEYKKITTGFVVQNYELVNGEYVCSSQEFEAGDEVSREDDMGDEVDIDGLEEEEVYQPMDMVQPE